MSWIKEGNGVDTSSAIKTLTKISAGAVMIFLPARLQEGEGRDRFKKVIAKIHALLDEEFSDLDERGRQGASIVIATSWAISLLLKIEEMTAEMKRKGKL